MFLSFENIHKDCVYTRKELAKIWGYKGYEALARGVVTPKDDNKILLFVTEKKSDFVEQYCDRLEGKYLDWEGPTDHFAEERMISAKKHGDEIHLFYRQIQYQGFTYLGKVEVLSVERTINRQSNFSN